MTTKRSLTDTAVGIPHPKSSVFGSRDKLIASFGEMQRDPSERCDKFAVTAQADLIFRLRIINCDITIFLSICQFFTIWGPLNSHHPVISFDLFHRSLSEEIPQTNSAVS